MFRTNAVEKLRITTTGSIGVNNSSPQYLIDVKSPATTIGENLINFAVADAPNDFLRVLNGTSAAGNFYPAIVGNKASTSLAPALGVIGSVPAAIDNISYFSQPIVSFSARRDFGGASAPIVNRPLFSWSNYTTQYMTILASGKVGIGIPNPPNILSLMTSATNDGLQVIQTGNTAAGLRLDNAGSGGHTWGIFSNGVDNFEGAGNFSIYDYGVGGSGVNQTRFLISGTTGNVGIGTGIVQPTAKLTVNGKVLVGDQSLSGFVGINTVGQYLLYVQQGILTEKVKVAIATTSNWADYVFDKTYKLRPLSEVEDFIKANKHLPEIPSANEVVKNGVDLAEMDAKLLQKVEELTLYIIRLEKEMNELKQKK